jgi:hypothetical protein
MDHSSYPDNVQNQDTRPLRFPLGDGGFFDRYGFAFRATVAHGVTLSTSKVACDCRLRLAATGFPQRTGTCRTGRRCAKRRSTDPVRQSTQARSSAGIVVGVPHPVARRTRPVTEMTRVGRPGRLPRSDDVIEFVEDGVAGLGA